MDEEITSRPKIHRLPQSAVEEGELYVSRAVVIICLALLLVAIIPALWSFNKVQQKTFSTNVGKAQTSVMPAAQKRDAKGIVVRDEAGQMIGQIAKMPSDNEVDTHIKSTSSGTSPETHKQDNGKELLSIIGK